MLSIAGTAYLINSAMTTQKNYYDRVVALTNNKLNLVLMGNCVIAIMSNAARIFVYVFFTQIRTLETKVIKLFLLNLLVVFGWQIAEESVPIFTDVDRTSQLPRHLQTDHYHGDPADLDVALARFKALEGFDWWRIKITDESWETSGPVWPFDMFWWSYHLCVRTQVL